MIKIGITGGSGSGKTTVSDIFREKGIDVIDTDKVARLIVGVGSPALDEITKSFGKAFINEDKTLNRKLLGEYVFKNPDKLLILNKITHKYISDYVDEYIDNYNNDIIGIDGAVIIGSPIEEKCDYIVSVIADYKLRIGRITKRDKITPDEARVRIEAQKGDDFYIENSDYLVYNNKDREDLRDQIEKIINDIRSKM